jgi:Methenyl tetrahydrofolate cyclohydrolase
MGLGELKPFVPKEKVIELKIESAEPKPSLVKMNVREFCNETLSDSPAPGGGSVAALMGALGASLGGMVANLSRANAVGTISSNISALGGEGAATQRRTVIARR